MKKITKKTYKQLKKIVEDYESGKLVNSNDDPYLEFIEVNITHKYNPEYGDDKECKCGHPYYRHFDTYEDMFPIGCKYCDCMVFKLKE